MRSGLDPFSFVVISIAGWMNQRQQQVIEYLVEGNRVLREQIGNRRMRFTDDQRYRLPPRSPNLNAYAERWVRSVKEECLARLILLSEGALRQALHHYEAHYHEERNHQGKDNRLLFPLPRVHREQGKVQCQERLGGMLKYYERQAA